MRDGRSSGSSRFGKKAGETEPVTIDPEGYLLYLIYNSK